MGAASRAGGLQRSAQLKGISVDHFGGCLFVGVFSSDIHAGVDLAGLGIAALLAQNQLTIFEDNAIVRVIAGKFRRICIFQRHTRGRFGNDCINAGICCCHADVCIIVECTTDSDLFAIGQIDVVSHIVFVHVTGDLGRIRNGESCAAMDYHAATVTHGRIAADLTAIHMEDTPIIDTHAAVSRLVIVDTAAVHIENGNGSGTDMHTAYAVTSRIVGDTAAIHIECAHRHIHAATFCVLRVSDLALLALAVSQSKDHTIRSTFAIDFDNIAV